MSWPEVSSASYGFAFSSHQLASKLAYSKSVKVPCQAEACHSQSIGKHPQMKRTEENTIVCAFPIYVHMYTHSFLIMYKVRFLVSFLSINQKINFVARVWNYVIIYSLGLFSLNRVDSGYFFKWSQGRISLFTHGKDLLECRREPSLISVMLLLFSC